MIVTAAEMTGDDLSWHDRDRWVGFNLFLERSFRELGEELGEVAGYAHSLRSLIDEVSPFIQLNTSMVCPGCERVCCVNRHGYYDRQDLIYIFTLGLRHPEYREGLEDTAPCQFLSSSGCSIGRSLRPFRCNWYFCTPLLVHMENGPAKPYREFVNRFSVIVEMRRRMLEAFEARTGSLASQTKDPDSL